MSKLLQMINEYYYFGLGDLSMKDNYQKFIIWKQFFFLKISNGTLFLGKVKGNRINR